MKRTKKAPLGFEPRISCLQDRYFDQLSHGTVTHKLFAHFDGSSFSRSWLSSRILSSRLAEKPFRALESKSRKTLDNGAFGPLQTSLKKMPRKAPLGFEPRISCLLDKHFDQLSHGAIAALIGQSNFSGSRLSSRIRKLWTGQICPAMLRKYLLLM